MKALHLFPTAHDQAVLDMVAEFEKQLSTATSPFERQELKTAIASWSAQLDPPAPLKQKRRKHRKQ